MKPVVVLGVDELEVLVGVWENVEDEGRRVLEVHLRMLTHLDHLVHQLPRLLDGLAVDDQLGRCHGACQRRL